MSADNVKWQVNRAVMASNLPPAARLIMFVLSDRADAKTGVIPDRRTPSLAELAQDSGHGESTVKSQLNLLEELGWVVRSRPDKKAQGRYASTGYRIQVGAKGDERAPHKRARSKPPEAVEEGQDVAPSEGQEQAPSDAQEGQEIAPRGPGDSSERARSKPSYIEDDDQDDQDDLFAAEAATPDDETVSEEVPPPAPPKSKPKRDRKAVKPKEPDPLGDIAQELTVAFFERNKGRDIQPFAAIRGVVKNALEADVPRNVLAHAMNAVVDNGYAISSKTLSFELNRMWLEANGQGGQSGRPRRSTTDERLEQADAALAEVKRMMQGNAA